MAKRDRHYLGDGVAIQLRGRVWALDIYRTGKRFRRSLGTLDVGEALMKADKLRKDLEIREELIKLSTFLAAIPEEEKRQEIWRSLQKKGSWTGVVPEHSPHIAMLRDLSLDGSRMEDLMRRVVREEGAHKTPQTAAVLWEDALQRFARSKTGKVVPDTLKYLLRDTREFIVYAKVPHVGDATSALVDEWVSALQAGGASPKTAKNKRLSLSSFFRWAVRTARIVEKNPVSNTEAPKVDAKDPEYLTRDQFAHRMERIKGQPWEWVPGLSALGLRLGEIRRLDPERDIDIAGRNIRVRNTDAGSTKNGQQRNVVILDQALPYVMMVPKKGFWWSDKHISKVTCAMGVGNHLLRHTLETHLRLNGVDPQAVGDIWLGHDGRTGAKHYAGRWRPSEPPMILTYFGLPLVSRGIPDVPPAVRQSNKA
jgi:integrase